MVGDVLLLRSMLNFRRLSVLGRGTSCAHVRHLSAKKSDNEVHVTYEPIVQPNHMIFTPEAKEKYKSEYKSKYWQSLGFSETDEVEDLALCHFNCFVIFFLMTFLMFQYTYRPCRRKMDWVHREAYLRLHERESAGLPLISPDYVDPASIILPSDEELGDTPIII